MLPFDNRPWAKTLASIVVVVSVLAAITASYYLYDNDQLNIPEIAIICLLLLTIVPPNVAIVVRKHGTGEHSATPHQPHLHSR